MYNKISGNNGKINLKCQYVISIGIYIIVVAIAYCSLLTGNNYMKWDIWNAHYPMQAITSDAIANGTIPVWSPLLNFGTPYYAMVGTPVWYPITLFFDCLGYTPLTCGWEYALHIVIAAEGMFCLTVYNITNSKQCFRVEEFVVSIVSGLFYGFSGLFLSNAEHIMIIISAAWIPYVMLLTQQFIKERKIIYALLAGLIAGLSLLGGYPELFYNMFIILFLWSIYWEVKINENVFWWKKVEKGVAEFILICLFTIACASITIIPFLNISTKITRGGQQNPLTYSAFSLLSFFFPTSIDLMSGMEISMGCFYVGFFSLLSLSLVALKKRKNYFYFIMMVSTLYLCFGRNSILHTLFYKFLPAYSTFRFPTVWRSFVVVFLLLLVTPAWLDILNKKMGTKILTMVINIVMLGTVIIYIWTCFYGNNDNIMWLRRSVKILIICLLLYDIVLIGIKYIKKREIVCFLFAIAAIAECFMVSGNSLEITIGRANNLVAMKGELKEEIKNVLDEFENRNKSCEFAKNGRSTNGLDSMQILKNKTFDEQGYVSIKLRSIEEYKGSVNSNITAENPEVYFSSDYVTEKEIPLKDWLNDESVPTYQIHIDRSGIINEKSNFNRENKVEVESFGFNQIQINTQNSTNGYLVILQANYPGWKIYVDGKKTDLIEIDGCFIGVELMKGNHQVKLEFKPWDFYLGLTISTVYMICCIGVILRDRRNIHVKNSSND